MEITHYRHLLSEILAERSALNSNYSLRAFARDLEIEPAQLSRVLKGTSNISFSAAERIATKVFKQKGRRRLFLDLVTLSLAKKPDVAASALARIKKNADTRTWELSWIEMLSDWHHIALLDLISLPNAPATEADLAEYLGINKYQVTTAFERLEKIGLVERTDGRWTKTHEEITGPGGIPSAAIRRLHRQMIEKAVQSIDEQDVRERFLYARTMTIRKEDLPKLEEATEDYLQKLTELSASKSCDSLYQVNIQAFNLKSKRGRKK